MLFFIANRQEYNIHLGIYFLDTLCKSKTIHSGKLYFSNQDIATVLFYKSKRLVGIGKSNNACLGQDLLYALLGTFQHNRMIIYTNNLHFLLHHNFYVIDNVFVRF